MVYCRIKIKWAFEKYQQFLLGGPWSATSDLAFRKAEKTAEYFQIVFTYVLCTPSMSQN